MLKRAFTLTLTLILALTAYAQNPTRDFSAASDSLKARLQRRTTVKTPLKIESVMKRGSSLDFHFSQELSDYPWTEADFEWFKDQIYDLMPDKYSECTVGGIYCRRDAAEELITPARGNKGRTSAYKYRYADRRGQVAPLVRRLDAREYKRGMSGRHIALCQSHGRYYDEGWGGWTWQRAPLFTTVEDMYTQSYVLPFLIPMLENAGAYVMTPRERDIQPYEIITDNDPAFRGEREGMLRRKGEYFERGEWTSAGRGFADARKVYYEDENPFTMGTARKADCATQEDGRKAEITWAFRVPERGEYAVYISYKSLPNSTDAAHYTVRHSNGTAEYSVNQRMGGGTWIYLGTFTFDEGSDGSVVLDNIVPDGKAAGRVVSADAVKIGGGMGKVARGPEDAPKDEWTTSGVPSYIEGALYWEQWAGIDTTVTRNWEGDYTQDFASRGAWVTMLAGGSAVNPNYEGEGKHIPFDLSFGFHSDAGFTQNDSIIGTLSIYTLLADGKSQFADGRSRQLGRHLAGIVQDQVCSDIREDFDPKWTRRQLWNRSYSEARTTSVPGMLLELLSHQNFSDMKYGLDPSFRFEVSRAVYKGMLKFLSDEYGIPYTVQPLPVSAMSARLTGDREVTLSWKATEDPLEPTAAAESFILYTRIEDGAFDSGVRLEDVKSEGGRYYVTLGIDPDILYSYRIVAENEGGVSFPSETVCAGRSRRHKSKVLIVNDFYRVSPPAWFDTPLYAGFDRTLDSGVGYIREINYIGDMYDFRRDSEFIDNSQPGFGGSFSDKTGTVVPGNTFDFISIHGRALLSAGYSFDSASLEDFTERGADKEDVVDLLCGKQVTTVIGNGRVPDRYEVFPAALQDALRKHTSNGGGVFVSGAYIGTDVWGEGIYPVKKDPAWRNASQAFVQEILGYKWVTDHGCYNGRIEHTSSKTLNLKVLKHPIEFHQTLNGAVYCVENPDGIQPVDKNGSVILKYSDNGVPAAVAYDAAGYRAVSFGFPLEVLKDGNDLEVIIHRTMEYITGKKE